MKNKSRAFSLIELSIVILIIGILIAGVTQASRLVRESKLKTAQTLTKSSPVAGIKGLVFWFETTLDESFANYPAVTSFVGSQTTEEGSLIHVWTDINPQSSSKYYMNDSYEYSPKYSASSGPNGLPSILFYNTNNIESRAELDLVSSPADLYSGGNYAEIKAAKLSYFIVYSVPNPNSTLLKSVDYDGWDLTLSNSGNPYRYNGYDALSEISSSPEIASTTSNGSRFNLYINGTPKLSYEAGDLDYGNNFWIEGSYGESYVSEVIAFNRALKDEERQAVEAYLGKKYGIKVAVSAANTTDIIYD